jgi:hypothetical protein
MPQGPGPFEWEKNRNFDSVDDTRKSVTEDRHGVWKIKELGAPSPRKNISDFKPLLTNLAQTTHYEVQFGGIPDALKTYLAAKNVTSSFVTDDVGLLCNSASLPTTSFSSSKAEGNYTGVSETFANYKMYQQISLDFYVDKNYKSLIFLESWMEFISSGSYTVANMNFQNQENYHVRMQYPEDYKSNATRIVKFDRDYKRELIYNFVGLFPIALNPIGVSYADSQILKVSASFSFDRYIVGKTDSLSEQLGFSNIVDAANGVANAVSNAANVVNSIF